MKDKVVEVIGSFPCSGRARTDVGFEKFLGGIGWHTLPMDGGPADGKRSVYAALHIPGNLEPLPSGEAGFDSEFVERLYDGDLDARNALIEAMNWKRDGYDLRYGEPNGRA